MPQIQPTKMLQSEELVKIFSSAVRSRAMYPEKHPILEANCQRFIDAYTVLLGEDSDEWTIVLLGGEFLYEKVPLAKVSEQAQPLYRAMTSRQIESITVLRGVTPNELASFVSLLVENVNYWKEMADVMGTIEEAEVPHILFKRVEIAGELREISTNTDAADAIYAALKKALTDLVVAMLTPNAKLNLEPVIAGRAQLAQALADDRFAMLSRLHPRHAPDDLIGHAINTAIIAYVTGQEMSATTEQLDELLLAAFVFDLGLLDIPLKIKDGVLRASADKRIYLEHPMRGMGVISQLPEAPTLAFVAAFEHHCRFDGKGFPQLPTNRKMNFVAALIAAASEYDKLLNADPLLRTEDVAHRLADMAGAELEPRVVGHLLTTLGAYPPGTHVKLTNGETAVVLEPNAKNVFRPTVRVLRHPDGTPCATEIRRELTLRQSAAGSYFTSVGRSLLPSEINA
jgi:HD-GYP domain-containing protein (c-di-GMP phosphodiesterase class II)